MLIPKAWQNAIALALLAGTCGCGRLVQVEGIVTLNGKPVPGAAVMFHPENVTAGEKGGPAQANGFTDAEGRYELRTVNKLGAFPGSYKVVLTRRRLPAGTPEPPMSLRGKMMKETLPPEYTKESTTPLRIEVPKNGTTAANLQLTGGEP